MGLPLPKPPPIKKKLFIAGTVLITPPTKIPSQEGQKCTLKGLFSSTSQHICPILVRKWKRKPYGTEKTKELCPAPPPHQPLTTKSIPPSSHFFFEERYRSMTKRGALNNSLVRLSSSTVSVMGPEVGFLKKSLTKTKTLVGMVIWKR